MKGQGELFEREAAEAAPFTGETMFTTTAGTFYAAAPYEEFAAAVLHFREKGQMIQVELVGGERTMINAAAIGQIIETAAVTKHPLGFR